MIVTENYIGSKSELTEIFSSGCKTVEMLGLEYEKLPVYKSDYRAVSYEDICKIILAMENSKRTIIFDDVNPMGLIGESGHISLEPGSQFELSLNPLKTVFEIRNKLDLYNEETKEIAEKFGICWLGSGIQPVTTNETINIIPKKRYVQMTKYLPTRAKYPFVMMRETAGIQVGMDYKSEEDAISKLKTSIKLSPLICTMFSNSPVRGLKNTGLKSFRAFAWLNTDEDRCGLISEKLFAEDFSFDDYRDVLLNVPMIFLQRREKCISTGNLTFGEFLKNGFEGHRATFDDWNTHLSLYFTDVRLKNYLEIRNHDSQKSEMITAVPALWKALLYNKDAQNAIDEIFKKASFNDFQELRFYAPKYGYDLKFRNYPLYDLAKEIINIAMQSLVQMKTGEECFLEPLLKLVKENKTPADKILEKIKGKEELTVSDLKNLNFEVI